MNKKIIISIIALLMCLSANASACRIEQQNNYSYDFNNEISIEVLTKTIEEQKVIQYSAHNLAEYARDLKWPENCIAIQEAQNEWEQAQNIIENCQRIINYRKDTFFKEYPEASQIWFYCKEQGWNDYICAGIMGNLMAEVGGQTLNLKPYSSNSSYYGICQWNKAYSQVWNEDLEYQCNYLRDTIEYEFNTYGCAYQKNFNFDKFLALNDTEDAALAFAKCYERCSDSTYSVRQKNALAAFNYFTK